MAAGPRLQPERAMELAKAGPIENANHMNRQEQAFAKKLDGLMIVGDIKWWRFEPAKFRVSGMQNWYTPDFIVINRDNTISAYDVKAIDYRTMQGNERQIVKIKGMASGIPWMRWFLAMPKRKKDGGGWSIVEYADRKEPEGDTPTVARKRPLKPSSK
jgi:hypothetical protein